MCLRCGGISDALLSLSMKQRSVFDGVNTKTWWHTFGTIQVTTGWPKSKTLLLQ